MRQVIVALLLLLCLMIEESVPLASAQGRRHRALKRPNILLIMADDMGFSDIGAYGGEIKTPNLDRLAAHGMRFTQFYNAARCCPTRASLLTGLYPHRAGMGHMADTRGSTPAYQDDLSNHAVTIAEALRPAGYRTYISGKWHVTPNTESKHNWPLQRGFDHFYGTIEGAGSYYDPISLARDNEYVKPDGPNFYYTDAISEASTRFIDDARERKRPFFLYVAYTSPHWPLHAPAQEIAKYEETYRAGWEALRQQRYRRLIEMGIISPHWSLSPRDDGAPAWQTIADKNWEAHRMAVYAAQIERMDRGIGQIVRKLEETGELHETIIMFLSDNGGCHEAVTPGWYGTSRHIPPLSPDGRRMRVGNVTEILAGPADTYQSYGRAWANASNTPFRLFKSWVHEGGISTPLIVHYPALIKKSRITQQPGHVIDLMATCLDAAHASYPRVFNDQEIAPLAGKSLLPIFRGSARRARHAALFWEHEGNRAVRQGKWKLVARNRGEWELYDMEADRTELHNLASKRQRKVRDLSRLYEDWAEENGVLPWDQVNIKAK